MMMNRLAEELEHQMHEALGPVNKWYCSQHYGYEVTNPEVLICYYIKHGGASHYRQLCMTSETSRIDTRLS